MIVIDEYDRLFPNFASVPFVNTITVDEVESNSPNCKVRHAVFINVSGSEIPHDTVVKYKQFYNAAGSMNLLHKNCDGVFCSQDGDTLILNMCELKTTALKEEVDKAKLQIMSVSTKLRNLLSHVQSYDGNVKIRGFIIARRQSLYYLSTLKDPKDKSNHNLVALLEDGHFKMQKHSLEAFCAPLKMIDIDLYFCEVANDSDSCTIDYSTIV